MYRKIQFLVWYICFLSHIQEAQKPMLWRKKIKYVIIFCNPWSICMQERTFIFPSRNPSTAFIACFLTSSSPFEMQKKTREKGFWPSKHPRHSLCPWYVKNIIYTWYACKFSIPKNFFWTKFYLQRIK